MSSQIKKFKFKPGLGLEIEIIPIASTFNKIKKEVTHPHRTGFYHIFWIQKGTPTHLIDFNPVKVPTNSLLFINKDRVISYDEKGRYDGKGLLFTDNFFCKSDRDTAFLRKTILFNDLLDNPIIKLTESPSELVTIFQQLENEFNNSNKTFHFDILHNLLHNFLLIAERERREQGYNEIKKGPDLDYAMLFRDLVEDNFQKIKSVSNYAGMINVSEKRLTKAITATLDKTPKELINERVLLEAKRLLVHTNMTIKEIGFRLGFDEPTNFIKYFRKHLNQTPIAFRESHLI